MFLFDYIYSLFFITSTDIITQNETKIDEDDLFIVKPILIHDINKIQLKPMKDRILKQPIYTKIDIKNLNKNQLNEILNVKLKTSNTVNKKQQKFEPRHPVLKELLQKTGNN
jgi:hypothetical protein